MTGGLDGAVTLAIAGRPRRLAFTWGVLAEIRATYGEGFQDQFNEALASTDFRVLAELVSLATERELSAAEVMRASPPIVATVKALAEAFSLAYHGPEWAREKKPSPLAHAAAAAMRNLPSLIMSFFRRFAHGWKAAAIGRNSGA